MTIYLNEKGRSYGVQIRHDGRFYYAAVFPCILDGESVTAFTLSDFKTIAEKRLNKKTLEKMNQILLENRDYLKHFTDPESLAAEAAHLCM